MVVHSCSSCEYGSGDGDGIHGGCIFKCGGEGGGQKKTFGETKFEERGQTNKQTDGHLYL